MKKYLKVRIIFLLIFLYIIAAYYFEHGSSCRCNAPKCKFIYLDLTECKRIGNNVSLTLTDYSIFTADIIQAHFVYSNGTISRKYLTDVLYPFKPTTIQIPDMDVRFDKIVITTECNNIKVEKTTDKCFSIYSNLRSGS